MKKYLLYIIILSTLFAQDITNKLGGDDATVKYEVIDTNDDSLFVLKGDAGAVFGGEWGTGVIPATGSGVRMMWYPNKAAFRAGRVGGTFWDDTNIGATSTAIGYNTTASGSSSIALGHATIADGKYSIATGDGTRAYGESSASFGQGTSAQGIASVSMGREINAVGDYTVAIALNDQNGTDITQSNTMAILGGKVGIGTTTPDATLDVHGTVKAFGTWDTSTYHTENNYQAPTDGIVVAYIRGGTSGSTTLNGYTDSIDPPTTIVASFLVNLSGATGTIMMPVKKDDYWRVSDTVGGFNTALYQISWLPLGQ